jgi:hypothetical protein
MLDSRIDLTENRDFGSPRLRSEAIDSFDIPTDEIYDEDMEISLDDYEKIFHYESIFGSRMKQRRRKIFAIPRLIRYDNYCYRCGKELIFLWRSSHLCSECDNETRTNVIPWKKSKIIPLGTGTNDIFNFK